MTRLWVAELSISRRTAQKIAQVHGITEEELRDAVECVRGLYGRWDDDPERGRRALIDRRGSPGSIRHGRALPGGAPDGGCLEAGQCVLR